MKIRAQMFEDDFVRNVYFNIYSDDSFDNELLEKFGGDWEKVSDELSSLEWGAKKELEGILGQSVTFWAHDDFGLDASIVVTSIEELRNVMEAIAENDASIMDGRIMLMCGLTVDSFVVESEETSPRSDQVPYEDWDEEFGLF